MNKQTLLTPGKLLNERGFLNQAGYATSLVKEYDRDDIRAPWYRIKEWNYYLIACDRYAVALTIADNSYMGLDSISLLDFETGFQQTTSPMRIMTMGRTKLPATSLKGDVAVKGKGYAMSFKNDGKTRHLTAHMDNFRDGKAIDIDVKLTGVPQDSMVIAIPWPDAPQAFYYNQKINCLIADGVCVYDGREYHFDPAEATAVLDWGRGVWTYHNTWYWGSASGLVDSVDFGFNIGYGFGDTSAASENMLFYAGKAHKLDKVKFCIPMKNGKEDYLKPWKFTSNDGRFEMAFAPIIDRASNTDFKILKSDQHQVFGKFSGTATLDDGTILQIKDLLGFAEKVENRW